MSQQSLLFMHRSVGRNLIKDGEMYRLIREAGQPFTFSDFDQNTSTLQSESVAPHVVDWQFPGGDTKPAGYAALFSNERLVANDRMLLSVLDYDIIAIKSCYPNSNVRSDAELLATKAAYQEIVAFFIRQTGKRLVILTSPPLVPYMTHPANAARARALADWLSATDFGPTIFVYNFFDDLAIRPGQPQANTLYKQYRRWFPFDSHPNRSASKTIAPKVVAFFERVTVS